MLLSSQLDMRLVAETENCGRNWTDMSKLHHLFAQYFTRQQIIQCKHHLNSLHLVAHQLYEYNEPS